MELEKEDIQIFPRFELLDICDNEGDLLFTLPDGTEDFLIYRIAKIAANFYNKGVKMGMIEKQNEFKEILGIKK